MTMLNAFICCWWHMVSLGPMMGLTHWGRATHICVSKLTIIASDNGLSPGPHQAIIWNNIAILSIGLLGTNVSEISIKIPIFSFKKMHFKVSSAKWRPFCLGLNMLKTIYVIIVKSADTIFFTDRYCWHFAYCLWDKLHPFATKFLHQYIVVISVCYLPYNWAW